MEKTNKKILIVEDDKDFLFILQKKFTDEGFFVITAQDGEAGLNIAEMERPDLILSDILLPKIGGIEMADKIKGLNIGAKVIFLTNLNDTDDIGKKIKSSGYKYLIKSESRIDDIVSKAKKELKI